MIIGYLDPWGKGMRILMFQLSGLYYNFEP